MAKGQGDVVIIGAGMSGMLAARYIKTQQPNQIVTVIDHAPHPGGMYYGLDLPGFGYCDQAMRMLYETGIPAFDQLMHNILPADAWHIYPDNEKDVAGIYWQGGLQAHSPYIDLRRLPEAQKQACEQEIMQAMQQDNKQVPANAAEYLQQRFGKTIASYLEAVLTKFYGMPATVLDVIAVSQPAMNRVVLYDEQAIQLQLGDERARAVLAWPDQLTLPVKRNPSQSALYPKAFGMRHVVDALYKQLVEQGVYFAFESSVTDYTFEDGCISGLTLNNGQVIERPKWVVAANGLVPAYSMLCNKAVSLPQPPASWQVYLKLDNAPDMKGLYHAYCFDVDMATFRVTHYAQYCPDAHKKVYPLCVELWADEKDAGAAIQRATHELQQMDIVKAGAAITASAAVKGKNLHALCSLEVAQTMRDMRSELAQVMPANMLVIGPYAKEGQLLLYEIWRDMVQQLDTQLY